MAEPQLRQFKARLVSMTGKGPQKFRKAQVVIHFEEDGKLRSRTRHIVKGPDGWMGTSWNYYDELQGPFVVKGDLTKHNEAKQEAEKAGDELEKTEKVFAGLKERADMMLAAFQEQEERGEKLGEFDELDKQITLGLLGYARKQVHLAAEALAQAQAKLDEVQEKHPLEAIYRF